MTPVYDAGCARGPSTRPTVHAHTAAASPTWISTSHHGSWFRYWSSPTAICTSSSTSSTTAPGASTPARVAVADEPAEQEQEGDPERGGRADVDPDGVEQVPEALDLGAVAGMRAGRGRKRPGDDEHTARAGEHEPRELEPQRRRRLDAAARVPPGLDRDHHRAGEHDEREQEVRRDHQRVQVEPDRQQPERSLRDRAEEDERRRPDDPAAEPGRLANRDPRQRARARSGRARRRGCRTRSSSARRRPGRTRPPGSRATTRRRAPSRSAGRPRR